MEALRSYLTPQAKKQRVQPECDSDEDIDDVEDDDTEVQPKWAQERLAMMKEMKKMLSSITGLKEEVQAIKDELSHVKLQTGMAQSSAEEALMMVNGMEDRVQFLETTVICKNDVVKIVDNAVALLKESMRTSSNAAKGPFTSQGRPTDSSVADKFGRTAVVGGFGRDTPKEEVVKFTKDMVIKDALGVEEVCAYNYGSVGFIRFESRDAMFKFLKDGNAKPNPTTNGKSIWISTSKSPEERIKAKNLGRFKRVLVETGLAEAVGVRIDYKRGLVFVKQVRVAEWKRNASGEEKVTIDAAKLTEVNINASPDKIYDAHRELMQE